MIDEMIQPALLDVVEDKNISLDKPLKGVYFILGHKTRLIKIGVSSDIWKRHQQVQQGMSEKVGLIGYIAVDNMQRAKALEIFLHTFYASCRRQGEWFEFPIQEVQFLLGTVGAIMHITQGYDWEVTYTTNKQQADIGSRTPFSFENITNNAKMAKRRNRKEKK